MEFEITHNLGSHLIYPDENKEPLIVSEAFIYTKDGNEVKMPLPKDLSLIMDISGQDKPRQRYKKRYDRGEVFYMPSYLHNGLMRIVRLYIPSEKISLSKTENGEFTADIRLVDYNGAKMSKTGGRYKLIPKTVSERYTFKTLRDEE